MDGFETTEKRVREAFRPRRLDEEEARRILSEARLRPAPPRSRLALRVVAVAAAAAAIIVAAALAPLHLPAPPPQTARVSKPAASAPQPRPTGIVGLALAAIESSGSVLHLVADTAYEAHEGVPLPGGLHVQARTEYWADLGRKWLRFDHVEREDGKVILEEQDLQMEGIAISYQLHSSIGGPPVAYEGDVPTETEPGSPDGYSALRDYKRLLDTGQARAVATETVRGVPTYELMVTSSAFDGSGTEIVAYVRCSDYLPIRIVRTTYVEDQGLRRVDTKMDTSFVLVESVPFAQAESRFSLKVPKDVPLAVDRLWRSLDGQAYSVTPYWLGEADFEGMQHENGVQLHAYRRKTAEQHVAYPGFSQPWTTALYEDPKARAQIMSAHGGYVSAGPSITIRSYRKVALSDWPSGARTRVARHSALEGVGAYGARSPWLILDMPNATVVLEGLDVTPQQLRDAAARLVRFSG